MFCEKCGKKVNDDWDFCQNCGNPLNRNKETEEEVETAENTDIEIPAEETDVTAEETAAEETETSDEGTDTPVEETDATAKTIVLSDEMRKELLGAGEETKPEPAKKENFFKKNMGWLIAAGSVLLIGIIALIVLLCMPKSKTLDLENYIQISVSGYDGSGYIDGTPIDRSKLLTDVLGEIPDGNGTTEAELKTYYDYIAKATVIENAISSDIEYQQGSYSGNLKNGDRITVKIKADPEVFKKYGFTLKNATVTKEMVIGSDSASLSGLADIDPFECLTPVFSGFNGSGRLASQTKETAKTIKNPSETVKEIKISALADGNVSSANIYIKFEITYLKQSENGNDFFESTATETVYPTMSKTSGLSNGDKVTFSVDSEDFAFFEKYGINVSKTSEEYTVDGLQDNVTVNLLDHLIFLFSGTDGNGTAAIQTGENLIVLPHSVFGISSIKMDITGSAPNYTVVLTVPDTDGQYGQTKQITVSLPLSKYSSLKNGDTVSVSFWLEDIEKLAAAGITVSPTSGEVTVSGLDYDFSEDID